MGAKDTIVLVLIGADGLERGVWFEATGEHLVSSSRVCVVKGVFKGHSVWLINIPSIISSLYERLQIINKGLEDEEIEGSIKVSGLIYLQDIREDITLQTAETNIYTSNCHTRFAGSVGIITHLQKQQADRANEQRQIHNDCEAAYQQLHSDICKLQDNYNMLKENMRIKDEIIERQAEEKAELQAELQAKLQAELQRKEQAEQLAKRKADRKKALAQITYGPYTPLHLAARSGRIDEVKLLLHQRANIEARAEYGRTPLSGALWSRRADVAKLLINQGANTEAKCPTIYNGTQLHLLAYNNKVDMVTLLLDHRADIEAKDEWGNTPLHYAIWIGEMDMARLLLYRGANIEPKDEDGDTPVQSAARRGYSTIVKLLLDRGATK
ncbi:uncharacterized protein Triagg1_9660 [Trichoderma aggressivum f. europaeum]|uniref:Ankyrin repeat protein n=1 Tax=Trichoderma aggressivum f. europaeum TaxID=173218 RepID=A0AAE1I839_9HYPO|nr:hypothetical protein Triagg1_9660 [Trichoderma aggressivum f. europaeum]